jgi:hypothetical protein
MAAEYEVTDVVEGTLAKEPAWMFILTAPDGTQAAHMMHKYVFEARAIEYDLHPEDDLDEILDMVLHEHHIPQEDPDDPAAAEGYVTKDAAGDTVAADLFVAETIQDAREAHQIRIRKVKRERLNVTISDRVKKKLKAEVKAERKAVRDGKRQQHEVLKNLKSEVRAQRRMARGRGDGNPLKARIGTKEAAE